MQVTCVAGARPNFMKIKPVLDALENRGVETTLVHTGQHYDAGMSDVFFEELGLRAPDRHLGAGSGTHAEQTARIMAAFEPLMSDVPADVVLVVGDVNSTIACALVAAKAGSLVGHVEAGLRSRDWAMPEEINRVATDRLSDYLFAPSQDAVSNLVSEGYHDDQIHLVGNVMVDTLLANVDRARGRDTLSRLGVEAGAYGLVTLHRPANVDDPAVFTGLVEALTWISAKIPLVFPVHPRTKERIDTLNIAHHDLILIEPAGYLDFIALESQARIVLTDSGGVQEETTVLGIPCLTLRDNTERPITVEQGTNQVVGRNPERIKEVAEKTLADGVVPRSPELWDGKAGDRIAEVVVNGGGPTGHLRPTDNRPHVS